MKTCVLLSLLLALGCVTINGAPVEHGGMEPGSCEDASTKAAAELALTKINQNRKEGYVFSLHHLSNAHIKSHVSHAAELAVLLLCDRPVLFRVELLSNKVPDLVKQKLITFIFYDSKSGCLLNA